MTSVLVGINCTLQFVDISGAASEKAAILNYVRSTFLLSMLFSLFYLQCCDAAYIAPCWSAVILLLPLTSPLLPHLCCYENYFKKQNNLLVHKGQYQCNQNSRIQPQEYTNIEIEKQNGDGQTFHNICI